MKDIDDLVKEIREEKDKNAKPGDVVNILGDKYLVFESDGCEDCAFCFYRCSLDADIPDCADKCIKFKKLLGFCINMVERDGRLSLVDKLENETVYLTDGREFTLEQMFARGFYLAIKPVVVDSGLSEED